MSEPRLLHLLYFGKSALALLCGVDQQQLWAFDLPRVALLALRIWPPRSARLVGLWP